MYAQEYRELDERESDSGMVQVRWEWCKGNGLHRITMHDNRCGDGFIVETALAEEASFAYRHPMVFGHEAGLIP